MKSDSGTSVDVGVKEGAGDEVSVAVVENDVEVEVTLGVDVEFKTSGWQAAPVTRSKTSIIRLLFFPRNFI
jgi:hypothetical protein